MAANVAAVREVVARARPDVALANHLVMGPAILARALGDDVPYAVKIHGSALEYTVKPYPRFSPFAVEGLAGARGVLVGSRHTAESLWTEMDDPSLPGRTRLGPPGVDVARFAPRGPEAAQKGLDALRARLAAQMPDVVEQAAAGAAAALSTGAAAAAAAPAATRRPTPPPPPPRSTATSREAVAALDSVEPGDRLVVFVGKLIASKGVELLLAAFPLVLAREPRARLMIVGFGAFRHGLERLAAQLAAGDLDGRGQTRAEDGRELPQLAAFLSRGRRRVPRRRGGPGDRVAFAGRLDHAELADLLPAAEAMAVTSTFPEAFGMVAAEAAAVRRAAGRRQPLGARRGRAHAVARPSRPRRTTGSPSRSADDAVPQLADALSGWLAAPDDLRAATRDAIVEATRARYSWDGVAAHGHRRRPGRPHRACPSRPEVPGRGRQGDRGERRREHGDRGLQRDLEREQAGRDDRRPPRRGRSACRRPR